MTLAHSTPLGKVDPDYRHGPKLITPADPLVLPGAHLKWYDIRRETQSFVDGIDADSREFIRRQAASGDLPLNDDLGFVINHLSGDHIYLLLVFTWRGNNEMWESAYYRDIREKAPFQLIPGEVHRHHLCMGVRRRRARAPRVDPISVLRARRRRPAGLPGRPVLRHGMTHGGE